MNLKDKKSMVLMEKRKKKKVKAAQDFAEKAVNNIETIKDTVHKKAEAVKDSAVHVTQGTGNFIKDAHGKPEQVKKNIKDGFHEVSHDMRKAAKNVSKDLKRSVKRESNRAN